MKPSIQLFRGETLHYYFYFVVDRMNQSFQNQLKVLQIQKGRKYIEEVGTCVLMSCRVSIACNLCGVTILTNNVFN